MIVTLTANPSLDRTVSLPGALQRGRVQRALDVRDEPGGKGVNVARVVHAAGRGAVAVLPGALDDPLVLALREAGLRHRPVPVDGRVRVNLTLAEPDGTTTKINEVGLPLTAPVRTALEQALVEEAAAGARWAVLSGSLPPGVQPGWYADLVPRLQAAGVRVAVDTSGAALLATVGPQAAALPDLVKPNGEELAELVGAADDLETDREAAARAAAELVARGVGAVLVTLGAQGALLVTAEGTWSARPPAIRARSTVGAGDSSLAGYLLAELAGAEPAERLRSAVAYGAAAAALPGSSLPGPGDARPDDVTCSRLPATSLPR